jgi:hypothetical protein
MNEINRFYKIFELEPEAPLEEVKKAYRDLVKVWHPDRFQDSQRLQKKANEKLSAIDEAYEKIICHNSHKEQTIREKPEEPIYEEQSGRDDQERKTGDCFTAIDLVSLLAKSIDNIDIKDFIWSLNERPKEVSYPFTQREPAVDYSRSFYLKFPDNAIEIIIINGILTTISLYNRWYEGYSSRQYRLRLPLDLSFSDDRQTTINKLGLPSKYLYKGEVWDRWVFQRYLIHIKFDSYGIIDQITLNEVGAAKEKGERRRRVWTNRK